MTQCIDAVDPYGTRVHLGETKYPRRELLKKLGAKHAEKVYVDTPSGPKHIGYIVQRHWFTLYRIIEWEGGRK